MLGHSWGGSLAVEYTLAHADKVKSLILASPVLSVPLWIEDTKRLLEKLPLATQQIITKHEQAGTTDSAEYQAAKKAFNDLLCRLPEPLPDNLVYSLEHGNREIYQIMWSPSEFAVTGR